MNSLRKTALIVLAILNFMMLIGQLWPAGAPPFARTVNIVTLILNLLLLVYILGKYNSRTAKSRN